MIVPDYKLTVLCEWGLVRPFDPARINPASIDLCIGADYYNLTNRRMVKAADFIRLLPGVVVLATTLEAVLLPATYAGQLILKSSMGRRGLSMPAAGWIDPGFQGTLTVQLSACVPVALPVGKPFVQMVLYQMAGVPDHAYTGRYQGQNGVTLARDDGQASQDEVVNEHYPMQSERLVLADWKEGAGL